MRLLCTIGPACVVLLGCAAGATPRARSQPGAPKDSVPIVDLATQDSESMAGAEDARTPASLDSRCGRDIVIDDGEDQNNQNLLGGYWFTYADSAGSAIEPQPGALGGIFKMSEGGANGSRFAARAFGVVGNTEIRYAGMGLNFRDPKATFDASRYEGVAFFAKTGAGVAVTRLRVSFPDRNTDPDGGICSGCYNHFGVDLDLTTDWASYEVRFSELEQVSGWGDPRPESIDATSLYGVQFQVSDSGSFDVWLDDLRFESCKG